MVISGIGVALVGIISEKIFFQDYWNPPLIYRFGTFGGIEDLMFGFAAGSIGAVLFNVIFRKKSVQNRKPKIIILPIVIISEYLSVQILTNLIQINSIYSSAIGFLIPALIIISTRRELLLDTILSAFACGIILILTEGVLLVTFGQNYLENFYLLHGKAPILFGIFPITEFIWGFSFGAIIGPLYEFATGRSVASKIKI